MSHLRCRDLSDEDIDRIVTWLGEQERGDIGFHELANRIIRTFAQPELFSRAVLDVLAEMRRQVEVKGFDAAHDDAHDAGELACAAACYLVGDVDPRAGPPSLWPWDASYWKPKDERFDLVRAAALAIKEIERRDRAAKRGRRWSAA